MKANFTSIVIAVHNQLEYTKMCLDSLSTLTPRDLYELIIVDNDSTDETPGLLAEYEAKTIRNDENTGVTPGWNLGINEAKGEFITFLHNDVLLTPRWLENIHHFESRTAVAIPNFFVKHKPSEWEYLHKKWGLTLPGSPVEGPEFQQHLTKLKSIHLPAQKPIYEAIPKVDKITKRSKSSALFRILSFAPKKL